MSAFTYLYIYLQSNALELLFYVPFFISKKIPFLEKIFFFSICNSLTHPIVFFGFMASPMTILSSILWAELFAVVAESILIYFFYPEKFHFKKILMISALANFVSWQLAPVLTGFIAKVFL